MMSYSQFPRNYAPATSSRPGLMSSTDKSKLDGIEANANNYVLPAATTSALGGVMPDGTTITVSSSVISAADQLNGAKTSTNCSIIKLVYGRVGKAEPWGCCVVGKSLRRG